MYKRFAFIPEIGWNNSSVGTSDSAIAWSEEVKNRSQISNEYGELYSTITQFHLQSTTRYA